MLITLVIKLFIVLCVISIPISIFVGFIITYTVLTFGDGQGDDEDSSLTHLDHGFQSKLPPGILPPGLPTLKAVAPAVTPQEQKKDEVKVGKFLEILRQLE